MSQARLDRIALALRAFNESGGRATYWHLKELIVRTAGISFVTADRYITEMAAMGKIKAEGAFWVITESGET